MVEGLEEIEQVGVLTETVALCEALPPAILPQVSV
jgi:hypothetical protein